MYFNIYKIYQVIGSIKSVNGRILKVLEQLSKAKLFFFFQFGQK